MTYILLVTLKLLVNVWKYFVNLLIMNCLTFCWRLYCVWGNKRSFGKIKERIRRFCILFWWFSDCFIFFLPDCYRKCFDFITENEKFQENFDRIKQCFVEDFIKQLKRIMQKSEIYKTEKKICKKFINNQ